MPNPLRADLLLRAGNVATLEPAAAPRATPEAGPGARAQRARGAGAAGDVGLREGWSVAVSGGKVSWVGPDREWDGDAAQVLDCTGRLVTPGFVDPHTHLVYAGDRAGELALKLAGKSYLEILAAGGGIMHTVRLTRAAATAELASQAAGRLREMVACGTTTLEAKSGYGLETATELRMLEAHRELRKSQGVGLVSTFLGAHAVPKEYKDRAGGRGAQEYVDLVLQEMLPAVARQGEARFCDVFVDEGVFTAQQGLDILRAAAALGLKGRLHADEIAETGGAALAAQARCVSADHLLRVSDDGIEAMAKAGTIATLMPTVPLTLMQPQWAPASRLLAAGVPVALASDHNPNNPVTSMGLVAQLGCYTLGLTPEQALTAVTWNAACALDVQHEVGSIAPGKRADLLVHDVPGLPQWATQLGRNTVERVVLGGTLL